MKYRQIGRLAVLGGRSFLLAIGLFVLAAVGALFLAAQIDSPHYQQGSEAQ
jgi:hypothetical protein